MFTGALVDSSLFRLSGIIMTHLGRKTAAIICTSTMALAIGLLPLAGSFAAMIALAAFDDFHLMQGGESGIKPL